MNRRSFLGMALAFMGAIGLPGRFAKRPIQTLQIGLYFSPEPESVDRREWLLGAWNHGELAVRHCGGVTRYTAETVPLVDVPCPCGSERHWIVMWRKA